MNLDTPGRADTLCAGSGANSAPTQDPNTGVITQRPDYIGQTGTITFPASGGTGGEFAEIVIYVCSDGRNERNEQFVVVLTPVNNQTGTVASTGQFGVGTILNDDAYFFTVTPSVVINEGGTPAGGSGGSSNASFTIT